MITIAGKRILICGKGGSGKSTIVALMADVLQGKGYQTLVIDGDASNLEGLTSLMFGREIKDAPKPLIDFFGGIHHVTCPVKDPHTLTRVNDWVPLSEKRIDIFKEIPSEYYIQEKGICLFQAGKLDRYGQGCDGPIEKIVRDFLVEGDWVSLVDMKAGLEQFGRRIPDYMDIILAVLDPTIEASSIAKKIATFCEEIGMQNYWFILNKIDSGEMKSLIMDRLRDLRAKVLGTVSFDPDLSKKQIKGDLSMSKYLYNDIEMAVKRLEVFSSCIDNGWDEL